MIYKALEGAMLHPASRQKSGPTESFRTAPVAARLLIRSGLSP